MGKFTAIETYERFESLWNNNAIDSHSLNFILDTGQLFTQGIFLNSVVYGTEANNAVPITIAGVQKTLALSNHTHANYLEKNSNIDITTYKITSGQKDLIYLENNKIYVGDTTIPIQLQSSTDLKSYKNNHEYTILDTDNFSIENKTITNYILNNVATFKYGGNSFQLDYVKRINTSSTFDTLATYTSAGTTLVNNKQYGIVTFYTDGTTQNPSWAQLRINIPDRTMEYRTSSQTNNWISLNSPELVQNALNQAGIVAAPSSETINMVWKTDAQGNPAWREDTTSTNSWRSIYINDDALPKLGDATSTGGLYIKAGTGISVNWVDSKIVITNTSLNVWNAGSDSQAGYVPQATKGKFLYCNATSGSLEWVDDNNTWKAANTSQEGYVPKLELNTTDTISTQSTDYVLVYKYGTETTPVWRKLPANAFENTQRGIYVGGESKVSTNMLPINFVAGTNVNIDYEAAGTSSGQSGNTGYFNIKIAATNTWNAMTGATNEANGTVGYINATPPSDGYNTKYWRADGSWAIPTNTTYKLSINNSTNGDSTNGVNLGSIYAPTSNGTGFLKGIAGQDGAITWSWDDTIYATPDVTATLTTNSIALDSTGWTDTGLSDSTTGLATTGTYAIQITQGTGYYSGVFSWYAGTGGMAEEISLHYAGNTTPTRLYMKTEGGKIYLAADDTISATNYTIKIRKLI